MKRTLSVDQIVFGYLYPFQAESDPPNWEAYCKQFILPEIRKETSRFYGEHESMEAKYPGLDYRLPHHRRRLARFPHHRRLFEAFDRLDLSPTEIYHFCNWEGTLLVKERYESERKVRILDSTGSDVPLWQDPPPRAETPRPLHLPQYSISTLSRSSTVRQSTPRPQLPQIRPRQGEQACIYSETEDGEVEDEMDVAPELQPSVPMTMYTDHEISPYTQEWQDHFTRLAGGSGWSHSVQNRILQGVIEHQPPVRAEPVQDGGRYRRRAQPLVNS